jgi:hypothetical protein
MEISGLKIEGKFELRQIMIVVLARQTVSTSRGESHIQFYAQKEPAAVIYSTATGHKAIDMEGQEIDLQELLLQVPGLADML